MLASTLIFILAGAFLFLAGCTTQQPFLSEQTFPYQYTGDINKAGLQEPSGIVYHPVRQTLFVVGDEGDICEMTTNGTLIQMKHIRDDHEGDFEGITVHPDTGLLYVAAEGRDTILEIDPEGLQVRREFPLNRTYKGKELISSGGQGIEGITFVPDATGETFLISNQSFDLEDQNDPSIIMKVRVPLHSTGKSKQEAVIIDYCSPEIIDISGVYYNPRTDTIIGLSDANNTIFEIGQERRILNRAPLPGKDQEGIAIDAHGNVYIAQDSGEIIKYIPE